MLNCEFSRLKELPNAKKEAAGGDPAPEGGSMYADPEPKAVE